jgi:hypothetical protein
MFIYIPLMLQIVMVFSSGGLFLATKEISVVRNVGRR